MSSSNSWTPAALPDQSGRRVVITGATGGLGYHTAFELANHGASVVLAVRGTTKGEETAAKIRDDLPDADVSVLLCDLSSLASVRRAAEAAGSYDRVDILINNAGVMAPPQRQTEDGFELQMGTNHLGHFALTGLLMPELSRSLAPRVVTVTSAMHRTVRGLNLTDPRAHGRYRKWTAYSESKLANLLFARELDRRARPPSSECLRPWARGHPCGQRPILTSRAGRWSVRPDWVACVAVQGSSAQVRLLATLPLRPACGHGRRPRPASRCTSSATWRSWLHRSWCRSMRPWLSLACSRKPREASWVTI